MEAVDQASPETSAPALTPAERLNTGMHLIKNHSIAAMGIGVLPAPGLDLIALTGIQLNLVRKLGEMYGHKLSDHLGTKLIGSLLTGYLPLAIAAPVASVLKFIPGVGIAAGVLAQSTLAGATTYGVGKLFLDHFESNGSFLDFDAAKMKEKFKEKAEEGKDFLKKATTGSKPSSV
jgi:uncharacterized protein (DUF697 family)